MVEYMSQIKTKCPICNKPLRVNVWIADDPANACQDSDQRICNIIRSCEHYVWIPVGNACYYDADMYPDLCSGVDELKAKAIDIVRDGTTIWLLVPRS